MNAVVRGHFEPRLAYSLKFFDYIDCLFVDKLLKVFNVPDTDFEATSTVSHYYGACIIDTGKWPSTISIGYRVIVGSWNRHNLLHHGILNHEDMEFVVGDTTKELTILGNAEGSNYACVLMKNLVVLYEL